MALPLVGGVVGGDSFDQLSKIVPVVTSGIQTPVRYAVFGDSRMNFTGGVTNNPHGQGLTYSPLRSPTYTLQNLQEFECCFAGGMSGDTTGQTNAVSGWYNPARENGKTIANLALAAAQAVEIQYGINDYFVAADTVANSATYVTNTVNNLKGLIVCLLEKGCVVNFQEIMHCTQAGYGADSATKWGITEKINAAMKAFITNISAAIPDRIVYTPINALLSASNGYLNTSNTNDGVHTNDKGARIIGKATAATWRTLLPAQKSYVYSNLQSSVNLLRQYPRLSSAETISAIPLGTYTGVTVARGFDDLVGRSYVDVNFNVTALVSGSAQLRLSLLAHVGSYGGATPDYTLLANDWVQGSAIIRPGLNIGMLHLRIRSFKQAGGSDFTDMGDVGQSSVVNYTPSEDVYMRTPRLQLLAGSSGLVEPPAESSAGLQLHLHILSTATGAGSLRVYSPTIMKVNP